VKGRLPEWGSRRCAYLLLSRGRFDARPQHHICKRARSSRPWRRLGGGAALPAPPKGRMSKFGGRRVPEEALVDDRDRLSLINDVRALSRGCHTV